MDKGLVKLERFRAAIPDKLLLRLSAHAGGTEEETRITMGSEVQGPDTKPGKGSNTAATWKTVDPPALCPKGSGNLLMEARASNLVFAVLLQAAPATAVRKRISSASGLSCVYCAHSAYRQRRRGLARCRRSAVSALHFPPIDRSGGSMPRSVPPRRGRPCALAGSPPSSRTW